MDTGGSSAEEDETPESPAGDGVGATAARRDHLDGLMEVGAEIGEIPGATVKVEGPGDVIDRYTLKEYLDEGGIGIVYRAEQQEPVRRDVALKVVKIGMDTREVVARFEAERRALAMMAHPNIAQVFDGGATPSGRPYFAMELVDGEPITRFSDRRNLGLRERLELFTQVCAAVQHAHLKGIIHRDIKPSNVLVAEVDGAAVPKVIDFGIARATGQRLTEQTLFTAVGQLIGTPAYMSPEQVGMNPDDVDARTDVYSLGVLLYEVLTGEPPFRTETLRQAAFDELCRIIREDEPPKPSTRVTGANPESELAASHRSLDVRHLHKLLHGEIDWIVMKALAKERERRYQTPEALAKDILRHLRDEAVEAGPPSRAYRVRKFARRNKGALAAAGGIAMAMVAATSISLLQAKKAIDAKASSEDSLYVAHMLIAQRDLEDGRIGKVRSLLQRHVPTGGGKDRRGWEWYFLESLMNKDVDSLQVADAAVNAAAWNGDGTEFATGTDTGELRVFDTVSKKAIHQFSTESGEITSIAWQPGGRTIASSSLGGSVYLWDLSDGSAPAPLISSGSPIEELDWSPDGRMLAVGDDDGTLAIWEPSKREEIRSWGTGAAIESLSWSPRGDRIATGHASDHCLVRVWRSADGSLDHESSADAAGVVGAVRWNPDGDLLAAVSAQGLLVVWNADDVTDKQVFKYANNHALWDVAWSPDSRFAATVGNGQAVALIDAVEGNLVTRWFGHQRDINSIRWHPSSDQVLTGGKDGSVRIWDSRRTSDAAQTLIFNNFVNSVCWSPEGDRVAIANWREWFAIWDTDMMTPIAIVDHHQTRVHELAWAPDGHRIASVDILGVLKVCDSRTGEEIWSAKGPPRYFQPKVRELGTPMEIDLSWSARGDFIATSGQGSAIVWDAATGEQRHRFAEGVQQLAWSPDGALLATTGSSGAIVQLWDPEGNLLVDVASEHAGRELGWSPGSDRVAVGSVQGVVRVVSVDEGRVVAEFPLNTRFPNPAWSPDGTRLAAASQDGSVRILDAESGEEFLILLGHEGWVFTLDWSPDGRRLATGSFDYSTRLWDATRGYEVPGNLRGATAKARTQVSAFEQLDRKLEGFDPANASPAQMREGSRSLLRKAELLAIVAKQDESAEVRAKLARVPPRPAELGSGHVDLSAHYDASIYDSSSWIGIKGFPLQVFPERYASEAGLTHDVRGIIQLNSGLYPDAEEIPEPLRMRDVSAAYEAEFRDNVRGIEVGRRAESVFLVAACLQGYAPVGEPVASVVLHYADGSTSVHGLLSGRHIGDWTSKPAAGKLPDSEVVWTSTGEHLAYEVELMNPHPEKTIATIDLLSARAAAAPFILAITLR